MASMTAAERRAPKLNRPAVAALAALACFVLVATPPVAAQERSTKPSAAELRRAYPLDTTPERSVPAAPRPRVATSHQPAPADKGSSGADVSIPLLALLTLAAFAAGFFITVRPLRLRRVQERRGPVVDSAPGSPPPAPQRAWTAEVRWQETGGECFFAVVARSGPEGPTTVVAQSEPLDWPPVGAMAVQRVTAAANELEASLVGVGWRPLPPGDAWYAKRFAWEPARSGRFDRRGAPRLRAAPARRHGAP
jgi:hypothetical protein